MITGISCSSSREVTQRRSLMMPKISDNPRNKKYKEIDYSKRAKYQAKKSKERRSLAYGRK
jgi:hypothetical protein